MDVQDPVPGNGIHLYMTFVLPLILLVLGVMFLPHWCGSCDRPTAQHSCHCKVSWPGMYPVSMILDGVFRPGLELMTYLDGNLSSNGLDDPALDIQMFHLPWWTGLHSPTDISSYVSRATIKSALDDYCPHSSTTDQNLSLEPH